MGCTYLKQRSECYPSEWASNHRYNCIQSCTRARNAARGIRNCASKKVETLTEQVDTLRTQLHTQSVEQSSDREETHTNRTQQNNQSAFSTQSYTERTQPTSKDSEKAPDLNVEEARVTGLSARGLSDRLGVSHVTIGRKKKKGRDIFTAWSKELDPDGLAWELRGNKYYLMQD